MKVSILAALLAVALGAQPVEADSKKDVEEAKKAAKAELKKVIEDKEKMKGYFKKIKDEIDKDPHQKIEASSTVKYEDDEQIVTALGASMHRRLKAITVPIGDFDTQQMVPGILIVAGAMKAGNGKIYYCSAKPDQATLSILALFVPEAVDIGVDWLTQLIGEFNQMAQLHEDAAAYNLLVYVQEDGRYAEKLEFRKKDRGTKC